MTPESVINLNGLTENVRFDVDIPAQVLRLERELPSAEELDRWFEAPQVRRAA
jgi:hypothetical protein